jgi:hypothetical protein
VDLMLQRVAVSDLYRDSPTSVRVRWAFRDFLEAHVVLDVQDLERAEREEEAKRARR